MSIPGAEEPSNDSPSWYGEQPMQSGDYTLRLTEAHTEEVAKALSSFKSLDLEIASVSQSNFPLPTLSYELEREAEALHNSRGFFVVEGLDASQYTAEENTIIYLGLASYVANQRGAQDRKGNILSHITNSKFWTVPESQRHGIHSNKALPFHNDMGCDILALQARHSANEGGSTYLSSAMAVYNYLAANEPDVARLLTTPEWPVQTSGRDSLYYLAPAMIFHEGRLMSSMDPNRFGRHPSSNDVDIPTLTETQRHALDRVSAVAEKHELRLDLQTGHILFFNNWAMLHRRDGYTDDINTSRHLVRLWLRNTEKGWSVPQSMMPPWVAAYGEEQPTTDKLYPLEPKKEYEVPKYSAGSAAFVLED